MRPVAGKSYITARTPDPSADPGGRPSLHHAGEIASRRAGQRRLGNQPLHILPVARIDRRGFDPDQNFIFCRRGIRDSLHRQDIGLAVAGKTNGLHAVSPWLNPSRLTQFAIGRHCFNR